MGIEIGDTVKTEGVVTGLTSDGYATVVLPDGSKKTADIRKLELVKKGPKPEPAPGTYVLAGKQLYRRLESAAAPEPRWQWQSSANASDKVTWKYVSSFRDMTILVPAEEQQTSVVELIAANASYQTENSRLQAEIDRLNDMIDKVEKERTEESALRRKALDLIQLGARRNLNDLREVLGYAPLV